MSRIQLVGVDGSNPLGFLAALGVLRVVPGAKLGFFEDGSFWAFVATRETKPKPRASRGKKKGER